jgi:hypothetical protein
MGFSMGFLVQEDEGDSMSYDARKLITFEVFRATTGTIWVKAETMRVSA